MQNALPPLQHNLQISFSLLLPSLLPSSLSQSSCSSALEGSLLPIPLLSIIQFATPSQIRPCANHPPSLTSPPPARLVQVQEQRQNRFLCCCCRSSSFSCCFRSLLRLLIRQHLNVTCCFQTLLLLLLHGRPRLPASGFKSSKKSRLARLAPQQWKKLTCAPVSCIRFKNIVLRRSSSSTQTRRARGSKRQSKQQKQRSSKCSSLVSSQVLSLR
ncbi:hypothetical protein Mapa_010076 [Marchantia paleacea]|nr:hypothetical protein Mapa_010076 [Marchantia paleacea]